MTPTKFSQFFVMLTILLLVSSCVSPTPATPTLTTAPSPAPTAEAQLLADIDELMTGLVEKDQFSGSLLVVRDGKVLISRGYGMANVELEVPNTPQTKFRLGSITKQFTALAILQLQQQGKLDVQDPICEYIRDCPEAWQPITIHHLLTHTSGIFNFTASASFAAIKKEPASPIKLIDQFRDLPLSFAPGEKFSYSNSGYIVLGTIIEKASDQPYATFLQDHIFEPLHMADTGYDNNSMVIMRRADGYSYKGVNAEYIDMSVPYAAGGLYSTVEDFFLWDQALYTDQLIPASLRNEMFTPFAPIPDDFLPIPSEDAGYGYGWIIGRQFDRLWIAHGGRIEGFITEFDRYPDDKVAIIVMSNLESAPAADIAMDIGRMIFEAK